MDDGREFELKKDGVSLCKVKSVHITNEPIEVSEEDKAAIDCFLKTGESIGRVTIGE